MAVKWEYAVLKFGTEEGFFSGTDFDANQFSEYLNKYGAEGWELVSAFDIERRQGGSKYVLATFKRPAT